MRHMFSHHALKPERAPIEANVWGTPKSAGSFSGLYRGRLLRALAYRQRRSEVGGDGQPTAEPFTGRVEVGWPTDGRLTLRGIYLSCGDSADTGLPNGSLDLVVTDPPFFDNVHYSELADFFYAWQQLGRGGKVGSTRNAREVQDADAGAFTDKLRNVLAECQLDIVIVCRKRERAVTDAPSPEVAVAAARENLGRLEAAGFTLSRSDRRIVVYGQLLTSVRCLEDAASVTALVEASLAHVSGEQASQTA